MPRISLNVSNNTLQTLYNSTKENDKLLFAKLSAIVFCNANGYDTEKYVKQIKEMSERQLIDFVNFEVHDTDVKSLDDICKIFETDMSDLDTFFNAYCIYNNTSTIEIYHQNVEKGNIDGVFETLTKQDKVSTLSSVTEKISLSLASIYTHEHLIKAWHELSPEARLNAINHALDIE